MRLGLGTVQFGLDYGISNHAGRVPQTEVSRILQVAAATGIDVLDTAAAYGLSEETLGEALPREHRFQVVTKTLPLGGKPVTAEAVRQVSETFKRSLERLGQEAVYGLLVHHAPDLLSEGGDLLWAELSELKRQGLVQKIGTSVYTGEQIDALLALPIDLIQLPLNVLDQRLLCSGHLDALKRQGVEIHVRSAFLQGVLLMPTSGLPAPFSEVRGHLDAYHEATARHGLTPAGAALAFLRSQEAIDAIIVGVTTGAQLQELQDAFQQPMPQGLDFRAFAWNDETVLDPSRWQAATREESK
ncbi:General stress protein 69 [compost metagenome]